jgi:RNA polymerase sigma factor (sigma-70 family)
MEEHGAQDDQNLMSALAQGKDSALNDLIERYQQPLYSFLYRFLQHEADALDLVQATFVKIYQNRARYNPKQKFSTWIFQIAANLAKDRIRWRTRHPEIHIEEEAARYEFQAKEFPPDVKLLQSEKQASVRQAIAKLPEDLRLPLILSQYEERSHAEIAEMLQCTPKAAETRIYRARQMLRNELSKYLAQ